MLGSIKTRKGTTKKSKQGIVLVTVLFILAIALIFIMSALLLTTATRTRLYTRAEDNQARLTVTAAAESFYQALYMQEITDAQLKTLDNASLRMVNEDFPGMSADDPHNMTWAYIDVDGSAVIIDFKTTIGDQTECIKMVLSYNDPGTPANAFNHLVNVSRGGNMNRISVGMTPGTAGSGDGKGTPASSSSNTLVFRDSTGLTASDQGNNYFYSTVFTTGPFWNRNSNFYSDLVFWGANASLEVGGRNEVPITMNNGASIYFIDNRSSVTSYNVAATATTSMDLVHASGGSSTIVFDNIDTKPQNSTIYFRYDNNVSFEASSNNSISFNKPTSIGSVTNSGTVGSYRSQNALGSIMDPVTGLDLLSWEGTAAANSNFLKNTVAVTSANLTSPSLADGSAPIPGSYQLSGSMGNGKDMPVVTLDVSAGDYYFYITSDFTIRSGYFNVINGGPSSGDVFFIILPNKQFNFGENNTDQLTGIVCTNCYGGAAAAGSESTTYRNYSNIVGTATPHAYIYSMGGCGARTNGDSEGTAQINVYKAEKTVINAYIGLYPASGPDENGVVATDDGTMWLDQGQMVYYGRLSCAGVYVKGGQTLNIPYCPKPGDEGLSNQPVEKYSDYVIFDYQYYTEVPASP